MGNIDGLFGVLSLMCGFYCLYAVYTMKTTKEINQTVLLSKDINPKKCKNKEAYLKCVIPKVLVLGIVTSAYGIITLVDAYLISVGIAIFVFIVIFIITLVWYGITTTQARTKYF